MSRRRSSAAIGESLAIPILIVWPRQSNLTPPGAMPRHGNLLWPDKSPLRLPIHGVDPPRDPYKKRSSPGSISKSHPFSAGSRIQFHPSAAYLRQLLPSRNGWSERRSNRPCRQPQSRLRTRETATAFSQVPGPPANRLPLTRAWASLVSLHWCCLGVLPPRCRLPWIFGRSELDLLHPQSKPGIHHPAALPNLYL